MSDERDNQVDPHDEPYEENEAVTSPETQPEYVDHISEYTEEVEEAPDGSGRVVTDADRGEGESFDPRGGEDDAPAPDLEADGGEDSTAAGRAE